MLIAAGRRDKNKNEATEGDKEMSKANKAADTQNEGRFVVVAVRHFENGEHHWFAPSGKGDYEDSPYAFGEVLGLDCATGEKPVFGMLKDAVNWAMSMVHGEWALAQWEYKRPTFIVITEEEWCKMIEDPEYTYPEHSEEWSDEQASDWERADDINWMMRICQWDSDSDSEHVVAYVRKVNDCEGLSAWEGNDGLVAVHYEGKLKEGETLVDEIFGLYGAREFPKVLKYAGKSDKVHNIAWFKVEC